MALNQYKLKNIDDEDVIKLINVLNPKLYEKNTTTE
jgi:hypothetical protein